MYGGVKKVSVKGGSAGRAGVKSNMHGTDRGPMKKLPGAMGTPKPKVLHHRAKNGGGY